MLQRKIRLILFCFSFLRFRESNLASVGNSILVVSQRRQRTQAYSNSSWRGRVCPGSALEYIGPPSHMLVRFSFTPSEEMTFQSLEMKCAIPPSAWSGHTPAIKERGTHCSGEMRPWLPVEVCQKGNSRCKYVSHMFCSFPVSVWRMPGLEKEWGKRSESLQYVDSPYTVCHQNTLGKMEGL